MPGALGGARIDAGLMDSTGGDSRCARPPVRTGPALSNTGPDHKPTLQKAFRALYFSLTTNVCAGQYLETEPTRSLCRRARTGSPVLSSS